MFDKCYEIIRTQQRHKTQTWNIGKFPKKMLVKLNAEVNCVVYLAKAAIKNI